VQPVSWAVLRLREGGPAALRGAQDLGRLLTGLLPLLLLVAALVEVSGTGSLRLSSLLIAPETPQQTLVRLLAGVGLLLVLPWWTAWGRDGSAAQWSASAYAGRFVQAVALSALWTVLVLPSPGDLPWAVALMTAGTLFAYIAIRLLAERWAPARRESEAAALLWATAVPLSVLALLVAFWQGV
jgi:hypothetical protein